MTELTRKEQLKQSRIFAEVYKENVSKEQEARTLKALKKYRESTLKGLKDKQEDEWLRFVEMESKPKTKVYSVISKCFDLELGKIKWYPSWRHYCFFPATELFQSVHSDRCLLSISQFITKLNIEHKGMRSSDENSTNNTMA